MSNAPCNASQSRIRQPSQIMKSKFNSFSPKYTSAKTVLPGECAHDGTTTEFFAVHDEEWDA